LQLIHDEEFKHFAMLGEVIMKLGADPTAMTPCADVTAVESVGLMQVVTDPRTNLAQSLHAMLIAELADTAAWELLATLAKELGHAELAARFEEANANEMKHLGMVRMWLTNQVIDEATRELKQQPAE
jgi:rubrerythrin